MAIAGPPRARIYVATGNMGKIREMHALFAPTRIAPELFADYVSPVEGEQSYAENAALKARALCAQLRERGMTGGVLADDSGLEVAALGGRPGVTTADYGGSEATWSQRRQMLLDEVAASGSTDRRARFVCAMHVIDADGRECGAFGTVNGEIAPSERGELGFSFDPIFWYPSAGKTFAEMSDAEKNGVSHRAVAGAAIVAAIGVGGFRLV